MNRAVPVLSVLLLAAAPAGAKVATPRSEGSPVGSAQAFQDLLELSLKEKKGLTFRVKGKAFPGVVIRLFSTTVEVRKPDHARVLIRLDRLESVALN